MNAFLSLSALSSSYHYLHCPHHVLLRVAAPKQTASGGGAVDETTGGGGGFLAAPSTRGTPFQLDFMRNQQVGAIRGIQADNVLFVLLKSACNTL